MVSYIIWQLQYRYERYVSINSSFADRLIISGEKSHFQGNDIGKLVEVFKNIPKEMLSQATDLMNKQVIR